MRIAVIGTGTAGNAAVWTLSWRYPVTVFERELHAGGHSHTITADHDGTPIAVDTCFIVYNELNHPDLTGDVCASRHRTVESGMSLPYRLTGGYSSVAGGAATIGGRRVQGFSPSPATCSLHLSSDAR
jgi:predicted NAD/FAD-binding protein